MGQFVNWKEWLLFKESKSKKRKNKKKTLAVNFLNYYHPYYSDDNSGEEITGADHQGDSGSEISESKKSIRTPNYFFDKWLEKIEDLQKEVKNLINKPETKKPETKKPETKKPETKKPETKKPETKKPETKKPETD